MSGRMREPLQRRRGDRIGGVLLAVLGIVVAVVAVVALRHPNGRQAKAVSLRTSTVTATTTHTTTASPTKPRTQPSSTPSATSPSTDSHAVPLIVLNNTTIQGLADTARQRFEAAGWTVTSVSTMSDDILSTCAYYDPSDPANQTAALQLQQEFPAIKRVKEKFPGLPPGPIVVVLTTDYS